MVKKATFVVIFLFLAVSLLLFAVLLAVPLSCALLAMLISILSLLIVTRAGRQRFRTVAASPRSPPRA